MKTHHQFIYLCCCATVLYFICSYSSIFRVTLNDKNKISINVELTTPINVHSTISNIKSQKSVYNNITNIEHKEKNEECLSFVSASCDTKTKRTEFKKLPENFAKVSF